MAEIKHGTVTVTIPDELAPPPNAGKLSADEVRRLPKPPRGIGLVGTHTADAIKKAGDKLTLPKGVTAEGLLASCGRADGIDQVIIDLEVVLTTLKQANLLFDAEAWEQLRKVNGQLKEQMKYNPELGPIFRVLIDFLSRGPRQSGPTPTEG
ncbi:hypothetical protein [Polyangium sp. 15x6]|uniref:hypothetical protein n=1 Tax=Polyangium sp. 15x6 TaxID=3042687 RepID=UPI00249CE4A1|nr:hypothetical protein [Polyangium sp. 15x6]MDI3290375.1 hypothetical protein [Polyangium sp. 15x6]